MLFWLFAPLVAYAFDCSTHVPFVPRETLSVKIEVARIFWRKTPGGEEEADEPVCASGARLALPVFDIRGREAEWYYCNDQVLQFECATTFQDKPATIVVTPGVVIRSWNSSSARDSFFHARLFPENEYDRRFDFFARALSYDLKRAQTSIIGTGGGRGKDSGMDSFYVKVDLE